MCILTQIPTAANETDAVDISVMQREAEKRSGLFHKTKLCKFHVMGVCTRGSQCNFAHGSLEKQPLPDFHCTKYCPSMLEHGMCDNPTCTYAHGQNELRRRKPSDVLPQQVDKAAPIMVQVPTDRLQVQPSVAAPPPPTPIVNVLAKTKMCRFHLLGQCAKGTACTFAHTKEELLPIVHRVEPPEDYEEVEVPKLTLEVLETMDYHSGTETPSTGARSVPALGVESLDSSWSTSSEMQTPNRKQYTDPALKVLYYKTKLCKFHARGACTKGEACSFAHDASELQPRPDALPSFVGPLPELPVAEGARVLFPTSLPEKVFLAVKNGFYTVDEEVSGAPSAARRSKSLPLRRSME